MSENIYVSSKYVAQPYVYGDSLKPYLVAIVVPDEEVVMSWAKQEGKKGSFQDLCKIKVCALVCVCVWTILKYLAM